MLIADGGGPPTITGTSYVIKQLAVAPIATGGMTAEEIESLFSNLQPSAVAAAGAAHAQAGQKLAEIANALVTHVSRLKANWSGTAADAAVSAFQQLHASATTLAQASTQTGAVLTWLGGEVLPTFQTWKASTAGTTSSNPATATAAKAVANQAAQQMMNKLNAQLVEANSQLPASISIKLPKVSPAGSGGTATGVGGGANAGGSASALGGTATAGRGSPGLTGGSGGRGVSPVPTTSGTGPTVSPHTGTGTTVTGGSPPTISGPKPVSLAGTPPPSTVTAPAPTGTPPGTNPFPTAPTAPTSPVPSGSSVPLPGMPGGPGSNGTLPTSEAGLPPTGEGVPGTGGFPGEQPGVIPGVIGDGVPGSGSVPGDGFAPGGEVPGVPGGMSFGGFPGGGAMPGESGFSVGRTGSLGTGLGDNLGEGLLPGESSVVGPDGMIGAIPGQPGPGGTFGVNPEGSFVDGGFPGGGFSGGSDVGGMADGGFPGGGFAGGGFADGNPAAGGADAAAADGAGGYGLPMGGGAGSNRQEAERYRDAWMDEDADLWDGGAHAVPSVIDR